MTRLLRLVACLLAASPVAAGALEPRYDHRDQQGPVVALELWRDSVTVSGRPTLVEVRPRVHAGWGFDLSGEGDELILGGSLRLASWSDAERARYLAGLDARYRGYFGAEELKTYFDVGLWGELQNKLVIGPLVGVGLLYDPSRAWGVFLGLQFNTGFGEARVADFGGTLGVQLRFE